jgi:hypothetical protein
MLGLSLVEVHHAAAFRAKRLALHGGSLRPVSELPFAHKTKIALLARLGLAVFVQSIRTAIGAYGVSKLRRLWKCHNNVARM